MTIDETIAKLDELHAKATKGTWKPVRSLTCGHLRAEHNYRADPAKEWTDADMALIAALHNAYPALRAEIERLRKIVAGQPTDADRMRLVYDTVTMVRGGQPSVTAYVRNGVMNIEDDSEKVQIPVADAPAIIQALASFWLDNTSAASGEKENPC